MRKDYYIYTRIAKWLPYWSPPIPLTTYKVDKSNFEDFWKKLKDGTLKISDIEGETISAKKSTKIDKEKVKIIWDSSNVISELPITITPQVLFLVYDLKRELPRAVADAPELNPKNFKNFAKLLNKLKEIFISELPPKSTFPGREKLKKKVDEFHKNLKQALDSSPSKQTEMGLQPQAAEILDMIARSFKIEVTLEFPSTKQNNDKKVKQN